MHTFRAVFKVDEKKLKPALARCYITLVLSSKALHYNSNWGKQDRKKPVSWNPEEEMADHIKDSYSLFSKFSHMSLALNISKITCSEKKEGRKGRKK